MAMDQETASCKRKVALNSCHLSAEKLRELFDYDPLTGIITNKVRRARALAGAEAGTLQPVGYRRIAVGRRNYKAHHIAWILHYGEWAGCLLDHINQDKTDNRIANLRKSSFSLNNHNREPLRNKFGLPGVRKNRGRFQAAISDGGKRIHLGSFITADAAGAAYVAARQEIMSRQITALWRQ